MIDKLYFVVQENKFIAWDCHTGQGMDISLEFVGEIGCLVSEGPLVFVGVPNAVKVV